MSGKAYPILMAGLMSNAVDEGEIEEQVKCIHSCCSWWNDE